MSDTTENAEKKGFHCQSQLSMADALRLKKIGMDLTDCPFSPSLLGLQVTNKSSSKTDSISKPKLQTQTPKTEPKDVMPNLGQPELIPQPFDEGFLRAERYERFEDTPPVKPEEDWRNEKTDFTEEDLKDPIQEAPLLPLIPKAILQRQFRAHCRSNRKTQQIDILAVLRNITQQKYLNRLPKQVKPAWHRQYWVVVDKHPSLERLKPDVQFFCQQLERWLGKEHIRYVFCRRHPQQSFELQHPQSTVSQDQFLEELAHANHQDLNPNTSHRFIILSDLGQYQHQVVGKSRAFEAWLSFGQRCRALGIKPLVWMPFTIKLSHQSLKQDYSLLPWCLYSHQSMPVKPSKRDDRPLSTALAQAGRTIISLLSLVPHIYWTLLRRVCREFFPQFGVSLERWVSRQTCYDVHARFLCLKEEKQARYQRFLECYLRCSPQWAESLFNILVMEMNFHAPVMRVHVLLNYSECFKRLELNVPLTVTRENPETYLKRLVQYLIKHPEQRNATQYTWIHYWSQALMHSQLWSEPAKALWGVLKSQYSDTPYPKRLDPKAMEAYLSPPDETFYCALAWQQGQVQIQRLNQPTEVTGKLRYLGLLPSQREDVVQCCGNTSQQTLHIKDSTVTIEHDEERNGQWQIRSNQAVLSLAWVQKPAWAKHMGSDRYGLFLDLEILGVVQRFRWIPPGEFLMGSPQSEKGRDNYSEGYEGDKILESINYDGERQFVARVSKGYWLADTVCTQALWQAVMGDNPSEFKGDQRPVENVSWDDIQNFLQKLNPQQNHWQLALPSEMQWEYACRAGTQTAYFFGESFNKEHVSFDRSSTEGTLPVKDKTPNAWGLYQMHGNVYEWCQDKFGPYPEGVAQDYQAPSDLPNYRVLRGGSWDDFIPGNLRSAYRYFNAPAYRGSDRGFRLSLGKGVLSPA